MEACLRVCTYLVLSSWYDTMQSLQRNTLRAHSMKRLINFLKPYTVCVQTGDFDGAKHRAWTTSEALDWAKCYPNACQVFVFSRFGRVALFRQGLL